MARLSKQMGQAMEDGTSLPVSDQGSGEARTVLYTGPVFAAVIGTILGGAGAWELGNQPILYALGALCFIVAVTMFAAVRMTRRA